MDHRLDNSRPRDRHSLRWQKSQVLAVAHAVHNLIHGENFYFPRISPLHQQFDHFLEDGKRQTPFCKVFRVEPRWKMPR